MINQLIIAALVASCNKLVWLVEQNTYSPAEYLLCEVLLPDIWRWSDNLSYFCRKSFTGNCCSPGLLQRELKCCRWNSCHTATIVKNLQTKTKLLTFITLPLQPKQHLRLRISEHKCCEREAERCCWCFQLQEVYTIKYRINPSYIMMLSLHCATFVVLLVAIVF